MSERLADPPHVSTIRRPFTSRVTTFEEASALVIEFGEWRGMRVGEVGQYHRGLSWLRWLQVEKGRKADLVGQTPSANDREIERCLRVYLAHPTIQARKPMRVPKPKGQP